jgi:hypothetical protein
MPGDPEQCRLNAVRCLKLAERAKAPPRRESLAALRRRGQRLAAEFESDQELLRTLSDLEFNEPCYKMPSALNLRAA